jgi:hypothetical protein
MVFVTGRQRPLVDVLVLEQVVVSETADLKPTIAGNV